MAQQILTEIQSNKELTRYCPNLDPNYLFRKDSQGGAVWEKLITHVAYFSSRKPVPEYLVTLNNPDGTSMTVTVEVLEAILANTHHMFYDSTRDYTNR